MEKMMGLSVVLLLAASDAMALDKHYSDVIEFNGRLHATLKHTLSRCPGVRKISKYGVDSLRNVYDPGEELTTFDRAAAEVHARWTSAAPAEIERLCKESLRVNGPTGAKWLAR